MIKPEIRTLEQVRQQHHLKDTPEVPILNYSGMSINEQDELLSEILGGQLRRRSMTRYGERPIWADF